MDVLAGRDRIGLSQAAADLLLGRTCAGCGRGGPLVCDGCLRWLEAYGPRIVRPRPTPPGLPMTVSSAPYTGPMRGLIHRYKEASAWGLADLLGSRLALAVVTLLHRCAEDGIWEPGPVVLVPAPSRRAAVLRRGSDVTARLAARAATLVREGTGLPVTVQGLVRMRGATADQAGLDAQERTANLRGSLVVRPQAVTMATGSVAVPVDDVITSGATMAEFGGVLRAEGIRVLGAATVAATPRRRPVSEPTARASSGPP
ncbi:ComF family protein [Raineyella fluvialis]|uniref:ComF family protein n=1 Tax=Raineyella fluvialis TaxID=2662261 RepID=A0A5Q2FDE8_9ACTN|nr:ComF family protein [Raineyella fluvialis]QGF24401.1 ComF family protein [Raineyella fluvialis]